MVHFGNYTGVPIAPTAEGIGDEPIDIATMHVVFMVSVYTLEHSARLRRGQKVWVQSTSRGQAAIELASYSTGTSRRGWISPVRPVTMSGISQLHQTLLSFFKGTHISKLVVSFQKHDSLTRSVPAALAVTFHWWAQRVGSVSRAVDVRPWLEI
ncbi:unnamed protein product [Penicillium camemberti]|uniref:Str. FM013 n=1 Tax=Penicillium camemberti (strain FM 013) TaxID=1429867 RepID=A0A0G4PB36_PENC3|nr:unnamed protein product [Penicillium camemberti]